MGYTKFMEAFKDMSHISHDSNSGLVTKAPRALKPLKKCSCGTATDDDKCCWCRIVERVGYDMDACRG